MYLSSISLSTVYEIHVYIFIAIRGTGTGTGSSFDAQSALQFYPTK